MGDSNCVIWLTGLPASGKTTIAAMLVNELQGRGLKAELLDGEKVRMNLNPELGFSRKEREMHAKTIAYISHLLSRNGIISVVAIISPFRSSREHARNLIKNFVEVWLCTSVETCRKRDLKGLYKKADAGKISNLTGVQDPYESPITRPEVILDTEKEKPNECIEKIISYLKELKYIN